MSEDNTTIGTVGINWKFTESICDENLNRHKRAVQAFFAYTTRLPPDEYLSVMKWLESEELEANDLNFPKSE